jgi:serine/threonine protein kinase
VWQIADFGSARLLQHGATLDESVSTMAGTTWWMAPEVVRGEKCGRVADVWSAGCVLIEMLTGEPPWRSKLEGLNQYAALFHIARAEEPPPMAEETVRPPVRELLLRCLVRDAKERPTAARVLAEHALLLGAAGDGRAAPG